MEGEKDQETLLRTLQERVKELNTLYRITKIMAMRDEPLETSLKRIADILPQGWQHPDVCCSRISYGAVAVTSPRFKEGPWKQVEDVIINGKPVGTVEVHYVSKRPDADEGPFLLEERNLIIEIASRVAELITIRKTEQAQLRSQERYIDFLNNTEELVAVVRVSPRPDQEVVTLANTTLCDTLGYDPEEIVGSPASALFDQRMYAAFLDALRAAEGRQCGPQPLMLAAKNATMIPVKADAHRLTLSSKRYLFIVMERT